MTTQAPSTTRQAAEPHPVRPAVTDAPSRSAGLRGLVQNLIAFGQALIHTLQASPAAGALFDIAIRFGTRDIALIVARVTRGLMLAARLDARLVRSASRLDTPSASLAAKRGADRRKRRAARPVDTQATDDAALLARMPTAQEIAASVRGKPIGIVLEEICRDLGITCDQPIWRELQHAIVANGGRIERILDGIHQRLHTAHVTMPEMFDQPVPSPAPVPNPVQTPVGSLRRPCAPPPIPRAVSVPTRDSGDRRLDAALAGFRVAPPTVLSYARASTGPP